MPAENENFKPVEHALFSCNGFLFPAPEEDPAAHRGAFYSRDFPQKGDGPLAPLLRRIPAFLKEHGATPRIIRFDPQGTPVLLPLDADELRGLLSPAWCRDFALDSFRFARAPSLWLLLRIEFSARAFQRRIKRAAPAPTDRILNELFLLHHYRVHCLAKGHTPDRAGFERFLAGPGSPKV